MSIKYFINNKSFYLPITDEEWTVFTLNNGSDQLSQLTDLLDYPGINRTHRNDCISKFNNWILLNWKYFSAHKHCHDFYTIDCIICKDDNNEFEYMVYGDEKVDAKIWNFLENASEADRVTRK